MKELARIEIVMLLQSTDLFAPCRTEEVLRIASIAHEREFAAGQRIFDAGDPADFLYCVVHGEVKLESANGEEVLPVGPLATFGVIEILSGRLRRHRAVAVASTRTLAIDGDDLFDLLSNNIEIVKVLFRHVLQAPRPE